MTQLPEIVLTCRNKHTFSRPGTGRINRLMPGLPSSPGDGMGTQGPAPD